MPRNKSNSADKKLIFNLEEGDNVFCRIYGMNSN
jgi:hypothetical protein